jgi:hypothetical protein
MADRRTIAGIPNFFDVTSNVAFLVVGLAGLAVLAGRSRFETRWEFWPYATLFIGTTLTAFGSAYYHLAPDNERLVWDRLPMTMAFMGLLTAMIAERIDVHVARRLFVPLVAFGIASVVWWRWSEAMGKGDLRLYAITQFGSVVAVAALLGAFPSRYRGTSPWIWSGLALYAVAKILEENDRRIMDLTGVISGHTLKHLAAAAGVGLIVMMLWTRRAVSSPPEDLVDRVR